MKKGILSQLEINYLLTNISETKGFIGKITFIWKNRKWIPDHIKTTFFNFLENLGFEKYKWFITLRERDLSDGIEEELDKTDD